MDNNISNFIPISCPWRRRIHFFSSIDSTNTRARQWAAMGAPHGTILVAEEQTGGRGRMGRTFLSPAHSGVYMSVILRPDCQPAELMHLTCAAAVAMCHAVHSASGFFPEIKWTNDLVYGRKKLAGILTELGLDPGTGRVSYAVVGVGINCCQKAEDFPEEIRDIATSLTMVTGTETDRFRVAGEMVQAFWDIDQRLLKEKSSIMEEYRSRCITLGQEISVVQANGYVRHGKALSIDTDGSLQVAFGDESVETVNSGEVSVRGMYGYV